MLVPVVSIRKIVHVVKRNLICEAKTFQLIDEMKRKENNSIILVGYWKCFTFTVLTNTAVRSRIDNYH